MVKSGRRRYLISASGLRMHTHHADTDTQTHTHDKDRLHVDKTFTTVFHQKLEMAPHTPGIMHTTPSNKGSDSANTASVRATLQNERFPITRVAFLRKEIKGVRGRDKIKDQVSVQTRS